MNKEEIRQSVKGVLDRLGDVVVPVQIIRKTPTDTLPGEPPVSGEDQFPARLLMTGTGGARGTESGPELYPAATRGLLESSAVVPRVHDDLVVDGVRRTLLAVEGADLGAGVLFDVRYQ
ncbi:hypothetical protein [Sneathiella chinensis]|uniref:Uncharacterized protein n=1 Tax=Sneathiella chinensis TaxID=349750 RepID=A0ABQ5U6H0_9PROT|nr:hypothetical protein [Sneathiella chinensis]GLQ07514.1 hypothetical protein GCM10007924_27350 [Sneathiella chinensis]